MTNSNTAAQPLDLDTDTLWEIHGVVKNAGSTRLAHKIADAIAGRAARLDTTASASGGRATDYIMAAVEDYASNREASTLARIRHMVAEGQNAISAAFDAAGRAAQPVAIILPGEKWSKGNDSQGNEDLDEMACAGVNIDTEDFPHQNAVEFYAQTLSTAQARRDAVLAAIQRTSRLDSTVTPVADTTASASIDTPEFMDLLCEFYEQASCEEFDPPAYDAARKAVIAHIVSRASLAPVAAQQAAAVECGICNDTGIVGFPPDQYESCPDCTPPAAKAPAAQAVDAPDAEHVARIVTDEDKAALLKIIAELGWEINGTWVITKSDDKMHTLDALAFARAVRSVLAASPASTPEASQHAAAVAAPSDKIEEIRALLQEAYGFAAMSPRGMENINAALDLLDEIATSPTAGAATTSEDAQRYLWLRNKANSAVGKAPMVFNCAADEHLGWDQSLRGQSLDEAIDAAMRATQQEGGK